MGWAARLGATWRGKVSGADLGALFASTSRLADLQQALADRRLETQIAQANQPDPAGQEWRVTLALGSLAAPIWLADALVGMAQAFYDEETQGQPDQRESHDPHQPPYVSPYTHDVIAALLAPVEDIIADVTVALADPNHHTGLTAPLHVGPRRDIAGYDLPRPPGVAYARGLAKATRRVYTAAASLLLDTRSALAKTTPPDWLTAGLQRLDGSLQGAGARLDMTETRMEPLVAQTGRDSGARYADPDALTAICSDLWAIADTALVAGQQISDPHLLPESPLVVAAPQSTRPTPRQSPIRASGPQAPARSIRQAPPAPQYRPIAPGIPPDPAPRPRPSAPQPPDLALPSIAEGAPSPHSPAAPLAPAPVAPAPAAFAFPGVGNGPGAEPADGAPAASSAAPPTTPPHPSVAAPLPAVGAGAHPAASGPAGALPAIGDASRPTPTEPRTTAANEERKPSPTEPQGPSAPDRKADDAPPLLPTIG